MSTTSSKSAPPRLRYHSGAYQFVFDALRYTQKLLDRTALPENPEHEAHISGQELLEGIRRVALQQFGLMTQVVFRHWGVTCTEDFGRIVFELVENGEMRKTDRDRLSDFSDLYDFEQAFDHDYQVDLSEAFQ